MQRCRARAARRRSRRSRTVLRGRHGEEARVPVARREDIPQCAQTRDSGHCSSSCPSERPDEKEVDAERPVEPGPARLQFASRGRPHLIGRSWIEPPSQLNRCERELVQPSAWQRETVARKNGSYCRGERIGTLLPSHLARIAHRPLDPLSGDSKMGPRCSPWIRGLPRSLGCAVRLRYLSPEPRILLIPRSLGPFLQV